MRRLNQTQNIGGTSPNYPDGVIVDNASGITGTALSETLYGDLIQTIYKIKRLSGITENGNPDNETNGFQIIQALFQNMVPVWQPATSNVDFSLTKWVTYNNGFYYHKTTNNTNNNPNVDTTNWFRVFYWSGSNIVVTSLTQSVEAIDDILGDLQGTLPQLPLSTYLQTIGNIQSVIGSRYTNLQNWLSSREQDLETLTERTIYVPLLSDNQASEFTNVIVNVARTGNVININGEFDIPSTTGVFTATGFILGELPLSFPTPNQKVWAAVSSLDTNNTNPKLNCQAFINTGSREVRISLRQPSGITYSNVVFNLTYLV